MVQDERWLEDGLTRSTVQVDRPETTVDLPVGASTWLSRGRGYANNRGYQPSMSTNVATRLTPSLFSRISGNSSPATPIREYSAKARGQLPNSDQMLTDAGPHDVHQNFTGARNRGAAVGASSNNRTDT